MWSRQRLPWRPTKEPLLAGVASCWTMPPRARSALRAVALAVAEAVTVAASEAAVAALSVVVVVTVAASVAAEVATVAASVAAEAVIEVVVVAEVAAAAPSEVARTRVPSRTSGVARPPLTIRAEALPFSCSVGRETLPGARRCPPPSFSPLR
jgi:hypothetical protein